MRVKCRVCGETVLFIEKISDCMSEQFVFKNHPFEMKTQSVDMYMCPKCNHLQIENLLPNDFYDDYNQFSGSNQYEPSLDFSKSKIRQLYSYLKKENNFGQLSLLDIGCGCGENIRTATTFFDECVGVEPCKDSYETARKLGCEVINGYFDKNLNINKKFTSFISMQVFEHLEGLYEVLNYAYDILEYGGVGLINVPNGQLIRKYNLYHQIILEHINYFTPFSLVTMAQKAGFDVLKIDAIDETLELDLYVYKPKKNKTFDENREFQRVKLKELLNESKNVSVWGAGAKSFKYSKLLPTGLKISHILDSSRAKQGKYISGIKVPIEKVTEAIINENDTIIIFASSYNNEIINELKEKYKFKGNIIFFEGEDVKKI